MRPYLLLDVDGVLSPTTDAVPPGFRRVETPDFRVAVSDQHGRWLTELSEFFVLVWATSWGERANAVYAKLLGLPALEVIRLPRPSAKPDWKLPAIASWAGSKALAWVDDEIGETASRWAAERDAPTLCLRTNGAVGLREHQVAALRSFGEQHSRARP